MENKQPTTKAHTRLQTEPAQLQLKKHTPVGMNRRIHTPDYNLHQSNDDGQNHRDEFRDDNRLNAGDECNEKNRGCSEQVTVL